MTAINSNRAIRGPVTAVPVVTGKGVRLVADTENNRWVVEADETVLWENGDTYTKSATLSESISNFEYIRVRVDDDHHNGRWVLVDTGNAWAKWLGNFGYDDWNTTSNVLGIREIGFKASGTSITSLMGFQKNANLSGTAWGSAYQTGQYGGIVKVIGINRIGSN